MDIKISVIIPTYNRELTIARAIRSVYNQTLIPLEVIVVDDASNDHTVEIIRHLQEEYRTLLLIEQEKNYGAQEARNVGIKNSQGDWIAFLDSDDEWLPKKLEIQANEIKKHPNNVAFFGDGYTVIGNASRYRKCGRDGQSVYQLRDAFCTEIMFQSLIVKKDVFKEIGYLDSGVPAYQEMDTRIRIAERHDFIYIQEPLFKYHFHNGKTISKDKKKNADGFRYVVLKNLELIGNDSNSDVVKLYFGGMSSRCTSNIEYFIYHGILSLYDQNCGKEWLRTAIQIIMRFEFLIRYRWKLRRI